MGGSMRAAIDKAFNAEQEEGCAGNRARHDSDGNAQAIDGAHPSTGRCNQLVARVEGFVVDSNPPNGLEMSRPASASIVSQTRFAAAGRVGSIELLGRQLVAALTAQIHPEEMVSVIAANIPPDMQ